MRVRLRLRSGHIKVQVEGRVRQGEQKRLARERAREAVGLLGLAQGGAVKAVVGQDGGLTARERGACLK